MVQSRSVRIGIGCLLWFVAVNPVRVEQATASSSQSRAIRVRVERFDEIQAWFRRVHQHQPWQQDAAVAEVVKLSPQVLQQVLHDLGIIRVLLDNAASKGHEDLNVNNRRLKTSQLAALLGLTDDELDLPYDVRDLAKADNPARIAISRLMLRAAILHTAIAISPEDTDAPPAGAERRRRPGMGPGAPQSPVRIQDGREVGVVNDSAHWAIARAALDLVGPPPASSEAVRLWYHATAAYLQSQRDYAALQPHLARARDILSADATTFLLSGAASENLAAPPVQSAIAESGLGYLEVGSPSALHNDAERYLRRALDLAPDSALTRLRLGRVLELKTRHAEAADLLRQAEPGLSNRVWRYFAALYLGRAEHALGRDAEARSAYQRAIDLFPQAQSPRLALAHLAWPGADPAAAVSDLRALFAAVDGADRNADPWWTYDISHLPDVPALWEHMRVATTGAVR